MKPAKGTSQSVSYVMRYRNDIYMNIELTCIHMSVMSLVTQGVYLNATAIFRKRIRQPIRTIIRVIQ